MKSNNIIIIFACAILFVLIAEVPLSFYNNGSYTCGMMNGFGYGGGSGFIGFMISSIVFALFIALVAIIIIKGMQMIGMFENKEIIEEEITPEKHKRRHTRK